MTPSNWSKTVQNWSKVGVELEKHLLLSICCKLSLYITLYGLKMFCANAQAPGRILVGTNPGPSDRDSLQNPKESPGRG